MKQNKKTRKLIKEWRVRNLNNKDNKCIACNGSGYYDNTGSPLCESCNGTGIKQNEKISIYS